MVIFLMLMLVTLGAFAIVSSNANFKLSQRALNWNKMYYELDARGEEYLSWIDLALAEAEARARDYMQGKAELPADLREAVDPAADGLELFNYVFLYWANELLNEMFFFGSDIEIYAFGWEPLIEGLWINFILRSDTPDSEDNYLYVSMDINPAPYINTGGGGFTVEWPRGLRYAITDWYEYMVVEPPDTGIPVWDGTFDF
jgi:hypothetical protein